MKLKQYLLVALLVVSGAVVVSAISNTVGAPTKMTGAPGEGNCTMCHMGRVNSGTGAANIYVIGKEKGDTVSGYQSNEEYWVDVVVKEDGKNKFGFSLTAVDAEGKQAGEFSLETPAETQLRNDNVGGNTRQNITHTAAGVNGSNNRTWRMKWKAPSSATGTVSFYASGNAANSDRNTSGDNIYTTKLDIEAPTSTSSSASNLKSYRLFPNPANGSINISFRQDNPSTVQIKVFNLVGVEVMEQSFASHSGNFSQMINLDYLPAGVYNLQIHSGNKLYSDRIVLR